MRKFSLLLPILILIATAALGQPEKKLPARQRININREWQFMLGDKPEAKEIGYDDKEWNKVNLPHNFSTPYFQNAQWYTGYGWYRKYFDLLGQYKGKRVSIEFEAAFREAEIFFNGKKLASHSGGYTGFIVDITDNIRPGKNVLAVRLNNNYSRRLAPRNGDHNFTGGIYRDVYLVVTNPVHVTWYGTNITTPDVSKAKAEINLKTEIKNDGLTAKTYTLKTDIIDPSGNIVAAISTANQIKPNEVANIEQVIPKLQNPKLWHPDHPFMYKAVSRIMDGKTELDKYETKFGIRWMSWTIDKGFFLNGEHYYFKGANVHQDHAGWANAVTNAAIKRDVKMIKDCGMDFIRGSHYPHDPAFSEACDSLGVLLWEENDFWGSGGTQKETDNWYEGGGAYPANAEDQAPFEESVKSDLREMIRIHRNHPSIIVWSMCNEPYFTARATLPKVRTFLKELVQLTHTLDPTRAAAIGGTQRGQIDTLGDVAGYNGDGARLFIKPKVANVVSEYGSTIAVRPGRYEPGFGDLQSEKFAWRSGEALWCAFDYGTRAGEFGKMGMIDYFRLPKNMYYWYRNEYAHVPPPEETHTGVPAKLALSATKKVINGTDGTDDVQLIVTVLDKDGKPLSNSPDVTLKIISGPGEFPTGSTITFSNKSDIYIRDGKAAIEFRSYYGGKTLIKAFSNGLADASIVIETKGAPYYIAGKTPKVAERPYVPFVIAKAQPSGADNVNIAFQKPTRASSEREGFTANKANDGDKTSDWELKPGSANAWWQVDMENLYTVTKVNFQFISVNVGQYTVEVSKDGQNWEKIYSQNDANNHSQTQGFNNNKPIVGRFLRVNFVDATKQIGLTEIEIFGKTAN